MESGTQLESEYLHVPLGKETAVGRKFIGFRQFNYPLFQGSDLGIHGIDHLKHKGSFGTLHTDGATGVRMTGHVGQGEGSSGKAGPSDQRLN